MDTRAAILLLCGSGLAQSPIAVEETRSATRLIWSSLVERPVEVRIDHGAANWREAFEAEVTARSEQAFRLGTGGWATLHAGAELQFDGRRLPAGIWYLALHRDAEARWSLAVLDPNKVRQRGLQPGGSRDVKPDLLARMTLRSELEPREELTAVLAPDAGPDAAPGAATLTLRWGRHSLSTSLVVAIAPAEPKAPAFRTLDDARAVRTASGLRYEELRPGNGPHPVPGNQTRVHYSGWLIDGTKFDASFDRRDSSVFPLDAVIKGWQEGLQLMQPGAVFLLEIPPDLAYGERGAGDAIPPRSTLVFWVELLAIE